jgi:hypothetical protein
MLHDGSKSFCKAAAEVVFFECRLLAHSFRGRHPTGTATIEG